MAQPMGSGQGGDVASPTPDASPAHRDCVSTPPTPALDASIVTLASGQTQPYVLTVDGTNVYWAAWGDNGIMSVSLNGGTSKTLATAPHSGGIAVDAMNLYWGGGPYRLALTGGTPELLGGSITLTNDAIAVRSSMVVGTGLHDDLLGVPIGGVVSRQLATPIGGGGQNTYGIALDSTSAYWSCFADPCPVLKTPLDGGASTTLATGHVVFGVAVDADNVYWAEARNGTIMSVPVTGGVATTVASGLDLPDQIAIDDCNLYVTTGFQDPSPVGTITRIAKDGHAIATLATGLSQPSGIAVDSTSVYWTTLGNEAPQAGTIMKLTPK